METFTLRLAHDNGTVTIHTTASTKDAAILKVCGMEGCPPSAVLSCEPSPRAVTVRVTYSVVTPESAEDGDFADHGIENEGQTFDQDPDEEGTTVERAAEWILNEGGALEPSQLPVDVNSGHLWWTAIDPIVNYSTGEHKSLSFHVYGLPADVAAVHRILCERLHLEQR